MLRVLFTLDVNRSNASWLTEETGTPDLLRSFINPKTTLRSVNPVKLS